MKKTALISLLMICTMNLSLFGQINTKTDTIEGNPITYTMDKRIEAAIEKLEETCENKLTKTISPEKKTSNINYENNKPTTIVVNRKLTTEEICRKNPKLSGYKIQLVIVKSNNEANEVKAYFRRRFPMLKAQTDASLRPNYKVLAGSYFTKDSASKDLYQIRQYFKGATIVPYNIYCSEAK